MPVLQGFYRQGRPCVRLIIAGTQGHPEELIATVDTGFGGFLMMSHAAAGPHKLQAIGTTRATFADGRIGTVATALANVGFEKATRSGIVCLVEQDCGCLVGIDFLRRFDLALLITHERLCLVPARRIDVPGWMSAEKLPGA